MGKMYYILILLISFLTGFAVMGFEMLGTRILAPVYGSNVQVLGAMLAVFMTGLGIGYAGGGRLADRQCDWRRIGILLLVPAIYFFVFPFYGKIIITVIYNLKLPKNPALLLTCFLIFILPNLFLGAVFPFLVKFITKNMGKIGTNTGNVYAVSTFGYVTGTVFTSFFLINWIRTSVGIQLMGIPLLVCSILCFILNRKNSPPN